MSTNWDNATELLTKAESARAQGDREMAYQYFARASELSPQNVSSWQGRAETATASDEALVSYAYASALAPEDKSLAGSLDAALAQRTRSSEPSDVPLLVALGQELAQVGLTPQARTLFTRASELDTTSTDALVWLAGTSTDDQARLDYLERALAANPTDPRARAGMLTVKLPPPPASMSNDKSSASAAASFPKTPTALASDTTENAGMERLRLLRRSSTASSTSKAALPPPDDITSLRAVAAGKDNRMRTLMLGLLALVAVLVIVGLILLQLQ
jgi:tetratricopeptide (TPR) repeat protein